ncbi:hypothetical protein M8494_06840 [Serratia ureilytica]
MCLAEAAAHSGQTDPDALIRDKISNGNWHSHLGRSPSLFVNAATWACCSPANWCPRITKPICPVR